MENSLYELYKQSSMNLHEVRSHYLKYFYYKSHDRSDEEKMLKIIVGSKKVRKLLEESEEKMTMPTYEDFMRTTGDMFRVMFKSTETQALAAIDAALRWDIEVNRDLKMCSEKKLKDEMIKVFEEYRMSGDIEKEGLQALKKAVKEKKQEKKTEAKPQQQEYEWVEHLKTWSVDSFAEEFGKLNVKEYANGETGELFRTCVFMKGRTRTFVAFSSRLGELTMEEIEEMKKDLVVVQLPTGRYCMARSEGGAR